MDVGSESGVTQFVAVIYQDIECLGSPKHIILHLAMNALKCNYLNNVIVFVAILKKGLETIYCSVYGRFHNL